MPNNKYNLDIKEDPGKGYIKKMPKTINKGKTLPDNSQQNSPKSSTV